MTNFRYHVKTQAKPDDIDDGWFIFEMSSEGKTSTFRSSYDLSGGTVFRSVYPLEKGKLVYIFYKKPIPGMGILAIKSGPIKEISIEQIL